MLAEVVFVTRFLALVSGVSPVTLHADASVRSIEIRRDDTTIATLTKPPWTTSIDLGSDIAPQLLTAIARDADGREVGRDMQVLNLARPVAEVSILLDRVGEEWRARIDATHLASKKVTSAIITLDGKVIHRGKPLDTISLGKLELRGMHSVGVELTYDDRSTARKEIAFGGIYSEQMPAELTPVAVRQRSDGDASCLTLDKTPVTPNAIEKGVAEVFFIILDGAIHARTSLKPWNPPGRAFYLVPDADFAVVWPVARKVMSTDELKTDLFPHANYDRRLGTFSIITMYRRYDGPVRGADAVAAAAVRALADGRRRAVVLVVGKGDETDESHHSGVAVRRYLQRIGVPLHVWSIDGPHPEIEPVWGPLVDVSNPDLLSRATTALTRDLESQRIAWMPVPPLDALRVESSADCAVTPLLLERR